MKNDYFTQTYRLEKYFEILKNSKFDVIKKAGKKNTDNFMSTIAGVAEKTEIPLEIVRADAVDIMSISEEKFFSLYDMVSGEKISRNEGNYEKILKGELDSCIIILNTGRQTGDCIELSTEELAALEELDSELSMEFTNDCPFLVKDYEKLGFTGYDYDSKIAVIKEAINSVRHISFVYKSEEDTEEMVDIIPLEIRNDAHVNILTCTMGIPKVYALDRIVSDIVPKDIDRRKPDSVFLSLLPQVWGYDFVSSPYFVKVKFYNDPGVFEKVRKDLANRTMGTITEDNNALYYEDTVYGIDEFKEWIYSFGNSAVVIKPVMLRQDIIALLKTV